MDQKGQGFWHEQTEWTIKVLRGILGKLESGKYAVEGGAHFTIHKELVPDTPKDGRARWRPTGSIDVKAEFRIAPTPAIWLWTRQTRPGWGEGRYYAYFDEDGELVGEW